MQSKRHSFSRASLLAFICASIVGALEVSARDEAFDFAALQAKAAALAAKPYVERPSRVPESLQRLSYDQYRNIAFEERESWWAKEKLPFRLQFFHPGFIQRHTVRINDVVDGRAQMIPFSTKFFQYRGDTAAVGARTGADALPAEMGFTGLRVLSPWNTPPHFGELVVFQGASYFRALSKDARYGLSARGLALNTAEAGGEEFPVFEEFWVERPDAGTSTLRLWALMDSPSVTGAYQFSITPGSDTVVEVSAVICRRTNADGKKVVGIAPLTSMFWFGETSSGRPDDLRPAVHDSDGLSLNTGSGEWIWRPLGNPSAVRVVSFADERPRGFGLMQRARNFSDYEDAEAAYHLRPSVWVEPVGDWGRGEVRLVELPTPDETNDNIVAFWAPAALPKTDEPLRVAYKLHWFANAEGAREAPHPPGGIVVSTRQGHSLTHEPDLRRFWVDFAGDVLAKLPADAEIEVVVSVGKGATLAHAAVEKNPFNNTWRAMFAIKPDGSGTPVEMRCYLKNIAKGDEGALTETWSYLWNP